MQTQSLRPSTSGREVLPHVAVRGIREKSKKANTGLLMKGNSNVSRRQPFVAGRAIQKTVKCQAAVTEDTTAEAAAAARKRYEDAKKYELFTLSTWLFKEEAKGTLDSELATVLSSIALACKQISSLVTRAGVSNLTGVAGAANSSGEDQKKLDVVSNDVFCNALRSSGRTGTIASEEEDMPVAVEETDSGHYVVCFDPLDGSSNIDAGISTGSIFGIYEPNDVCDIEDRQDPQKLIENCIINVCQPGSSLLAAGYCLYSSSVILVLSIGQGLNGFTYDSLVGEFILTHPDIQVPDKGKIYSFNEGNFDLWSDPLKDYIRSLKDPEKWGGKPYSARYIGSLVGDFHRTLLYGGIYGYPGDAKNKNGKLRLLYECAPMSFLVEQAGGKGSTGFERVLDVCPDQVHQRVPLFIGSKGEVEYLESFLNENGSVSESESANDSESADESESESQSESPIKSETENITEKE